MHARKEPKGHALSRKAASCKCVIKLAVHYSIQSSVISPFRIFSETNTKSGDDKKASSRPAMPRPAAIGVAG
jgi:hypothetical protein